MFKLSKMLPQSPILKIDDDIVELKQRSERLKGRFVPQPDITAYELACIFAEIATGLGSRASDCVTFEPDFWAAWQPELKRHFVVEE